MERVWAQYGRKARIPAYVKEELRLAGFTIRSRRTWLNRTQIRENCEHITRKVEEVAQMATCGWWVGKCTAPEEMAIPIEDENGETWAEIAKCPCKDGEKCSQNGKCPEEVA